MNKPERIAVLEATVASKDSKRTELRTDIELKTAQSATEMLENLLLNKYRQGHVTAVWNSNEVLIVLCTQVATYCDYLK